MKFRIPFCYGLRNDRNNNPKMDIIFLNRDALTVFPCVTFGLNDLFSMA